MLLNLTPHPLNLLGADGAEHKLPVAGPAPRLAVQRVPLGTIAGLPVVRSTMGEPTGLPAPQQGVIYIVSALVAEAADDREDLAYPGEAVRDEQGRTVGARGLCAGPGLARLLSQRCHRCGGTPDPENPGLALEDEGTVGGLGGCGDLHDFGAVSPALERRERRAS